MKQPDVRLSGIGQPLTHKGLVAAADLLGVNIPTLWSIMDVETAGCGYLPDKRIVILFEKHIFCSLTDGCYDSRYPDISGPRGGYGITGPHQHERLELAMLLDKEAALKSASWGLGQIMGFNFKQAGCDSVYEMVELFADSEDAQLMAVACFIRSSNIHIALQKRDWTAFARVYNGLAQRGYDTRLEESYNKFMICTPDIDVRRKQMELMFMGLGPITIDGIMGPETRACMSRVLM